MPARDRERLGTHSFRSGGATAAAEGGASVEDIMALGRWRSSAVRDYRRVGPQRARKAQHAQAAETRDEAYDDDDDGDEGRMDAS